VELLSDRVGFAKLPLAAQVDATLEKALGLFSIRSFWL
jgi:hypothetical protein